MIVIVTYNAETETVRVDCDDKYPVFMISGLLQQAINNFNSHLEQNTPPSKQIETSEKRKRENANEIN